MSFSDEQDHAERVDGPAISERRLPARKRQGGGGCCCKVGARRFAEREGDGRRDRRGRGSRESERAFAREGKEENGRRIRYLSRRCCVQVNKLTRRRASAIFFPINLNLLLTLFPCSLACPFPRPPPLRFSHLHPLAPSCLLSAVSALYDSLFPSPAPPRSLRASLSLVSTCSRCRIPS